MASLETGLRLADRYVLKERLGDGGHAEVWSALDERDGRLVALKFLHLSACNVEDALPVLRHEARMARYLDHPGVLRADQPRRDGDVVFLPVEFAAGGSASRLRGASWRRVVPVLLQVARVLEHAHARGIVHRDIKPGNVLFDSAGDVRIADFGTSSRTGSSEAPANGSPFSASPQQLRGEPARPADDVYGLGALAHELLTRYPPFYPHFDAMRVQEQDLPRPTPAQPAPAALVDLVQAMLARDATGRPALGEVIRQLEELQAQADAAPEGAVVVEVAATAGARREQGSRRSRIGLWALAAAAVLAVVVLLNLPDPKPAVTTPETAEPVVHNSVADAVVPGPSQPEPPAQPESEAAPFDPLADALRAGQAALAAYQPAQARAAFKRALSKQADNEVALKGMASAERMEELLATLGEGTRAEAAGHLAQARDEYRRLLLREPGFALARTALARVDARLADMVFEDHLATAADAMRRGDVDEAEEAYGRAAGIHARDARVVEGQQRIAEIRRDRQNAADLTTGTQLESAERWAEAVAHYNAVLVRDAQLRFAQDGLARSERRAALDKELADYQARPDRLTAPAVRVAAQRALARGEATATDGAPRLTAQLTWLRGALGELQEPVRVEITSDNSTHVRVSQVGELGTFQSQELSLPPGRYTVIGEREGFRDVRVELNLTPGQDTAALSVRCTERI